MQILKTWRSIATFITSLVLAIISFTNVSAKTFSDIDPNHRYFKAIDYLSGQNVIQGYSDGTYKPDAPINRAEFLKLLMAAKYNNRLSADNSGDCFPDIKNDWFSMYVCYAKNLGIIHGYPDGNFKPGEMINFVEALKIVMRINNFSYQENDTIWYRDLVNQASNFNFIPLGINGFGHTLTRGEMADMVTRIKMYENNNLNDYLGEQASARITYAMLERGETEPLITSTCPTDLEINLPSSTTYLILGRKIFKKEIKDFISFKESQGENVYYVDLDDLICITSGRDIPEKIRNFLITAKNQTQIHYLLLLGTPMHFDNSAAYEQGYSAVNLFTPYEMPIRYVEGIGDQYFIPTDQYYASLSGNWDNNNNNIFGESLNFATSDQFEFSLKPDLYVGRIPVQTTAQLRNWINKTKNWQTPKKPIHQQFVSYWCLVSEQNLPQFAHRFLHNFKLNVCQENNGGEISDFASRTQADFVSTYSHGNYLGVVKDIDNQGIKVSKGSKIGYQLLKTSPGFTKPPILFVHGCEVGGLDYSQSSLGEDLIAKTDGVVAMVAASRSHWDIRFLFWDELFFNHGYTMGEALYNFKNRRSQNESINDNELKNFFMFNLFGDPSLQIYKPDVELSMNDFVDFKAQEKTDIVFQVKNNSNQSISGLIKSEATLLIMENPITVPAQSTITVTGPMYRNLKSMVLGEIMIEQREDAFFYFEPSNNNFSSAGARTWLIYDGLALSCARIENNGNQYVVHLKNVGPASGNYRVKVGIDPGHYQSSAAKATKQTVYDKTLLLAPKQEYILEINKGEDIDVLDSSKTFNDPYIFSLLDIQFYDKDNNFVGQCRNGSLPTK